MTLTSHHVLSKQDSLKNVSVYPGKEETRLMRFLVAEHHYNRPPNSFCPSYVGSIKPFDFFII